MTSRAVFSIIVVDFRGPQNNTGRMGWMTHRKWKETKQLPGTAGPGNMLGCCLNFFHFRCDIHPICPVQKSIQNDTVWQHVRSIFHSLLVTVGNWRFYGLIIPSWVRTINLVFFNNCPVRTLLNNQDYLQWGLTGFNTASSSIPLAVWEMSY